MPNRWVEHVRKFASDNSLSYACALSKPECKESYRAKYGVTKKLTKKQNIEKMAMEDINVAEPIKEKKKRKPKAKVEFEVEEEPPIKEKKKRKPKAKVEFIVEEEPEETFEIMVKKPKKVKAVPVYNETTDSMSERESVLKKYNIKTLKNFLETQHNYKASDKLTKNDLIRNIMLIEAGLQLPS